MQLFLASSKLLEALCTLPAGYVAQFQMYVQYYVKLPRINLGAIGPFSRRWPPERIPLFSHRSPIVLAKGFRQRLGLKELELRIEVEVKLFFN